MGRIRAADALNNLIAGGDGMAEPQVRWRVYFSGRVQHVGFRYTAYYLARDLYLTGWVDNLPDGRVEMEAQGNVAVLRKLVIRLKSQPHIHITSMDITEIDPVPFERKFRVRGRSD